MRTCAWLWLGLLPALCLGDASQGELGGYRLGDAYLLGPSTEWSHAADHSLKITARTAGDPAGESSVYVYATPVSHTIGKIVLQTRFADLAAAQAAAQADRERLAAAYPDWKQAVTVPLPMGRRGGELVSRQLQEPYALIVFYRGTDAGAELVIELEFESASPAREAWRQRLRREAAEAGP